MRLHRTRPGPLFRSFAAATLLLWLATQVVCRAHCSLGFGHGEPEHASCHGPAASQLQHGDGGSPAQEGSSTSALCLTFKTALVNGGSLTLVQPELPVLYLLAPLAPDLTPTEPAISFFRQVQTRDWVFTPEVFLGPAFRSHAPPFLS